MVIDRDAIVFEKLRFQNVSSPRENEKLLFKIPPVRIAFCKSSVFVTD